MSIYATSYFHHNGKPPEIITKIDNLLIKQHKGEIFVMDGDLANHLNNLCIKFGFMYFCRDYLTQTINGNQTKTNFFISNFIFDAKSFLDSICMLMNYFYDLKFQGGQIDFRNKLFMPTLKKKKQDVETALQKHQKWIQNVLKYRDKLIHRSTVASIYFSPSDKTGKRPKDTIVKMSDDFQSLFDIIRKSGTKQATKSLDILEFCNKWIKEGEEIVNDVLSIIEKDYQNGTYLRRANF